MSASFGLGEEVEGMLIAGEPAIKLQLLLFTIGDCVLLPTTRGDGVLKLLFSMLLLEKGLIELN